RPPDAHALWPSRAPTRYDLGDGGSGAPKQTSRIPELGFHGLFEYLENQRYVDVSHRQAADNRLCVSPERILPLEAVFEASPLLVVLLKKSAACLGKGHSLGSVGLTCGAIGATCRNRVNPVGQLLPYQLTIAFPCLGQVECLCATKAHVASDA